MKNTDVKPGVSYAWARHKPNPFDDTASKVTAIAVETAESGGRRRTMVKVHVDQDIKSWHGTVTIPAGRDIHVPARELHEEWDARAARIANYEANKGEGARLKAEIASSLQALGIEDAKVWPRVGNDLGLAVELRGADAMQRLSDALAYTVAGRA